MADLPKRDTHRWQGYNYANVGAYYLTICTDDRRHWFGHIVDGVMHRSSIGELAQRCWDAIPEHMPHVDVGEFVVMPNHVHGIVVIRERLVSVGTDHDRPDTDSLNDAEPQPDAPPPTGPVQHDIPESENPDDGEHGMPTNDGAANTPGAQYRADHDRPLRPPTGPPAPTSRVMPIVPHGSLGRIMRAYKSAVTRIAYRDGLLPRGTRLWQHNYWDRIIRDDAEYQRIVDYIRDNPKNWKGDRFNG